MPRSEEAPFAERSAGSRLWQYWWLEKHSENEGSQSRLELIDGPVAIAMSESHESSAQR